MPHHQPSHRPTPMQPPILTPSSTRSTRPQLPQTPQGPVLPPLQDPRSDGYMDPPSADPFHPPHPVPRPLSPELPPIWPPIWPPIDRAPPPTQYKRVDVANLLSDPVDSPHSSVTTAAVQSAAYTSPHRYGDDVRIRSPPYDPVYSQPPLDAPHPALWYPQELPSSSQLVSRQHYPTVEPPTKRQTSPAHSHYSSSSSSSSGSGPGSASVPSPASLTYRSPLIPPATTAGTRISRPPPTLSYDLLIRQQPVAARACGFGERDRRVIDPPPIIQLKITDIPSGAHASDPDGLLALHCSLLSADDENDVKPNLASTTTDDIASARMLMGSLVASPYQAKDEYSRPGTFFVFPDLSCRSPGRYRLRFNLIRVDPTNLVPGAQHGNAGSVVSAALTVYTAKDFPGMRASSALLKALRRQGLNVSVKKGSEARKLKGRRSRATRDRGLSAEEGSEEEEAEDEEDEEADGEGMSRVRQGFLPEDACRLPPAAPLTDTAAAAAATAATDQIMSELASPTRKLDHKRSKRPKHHDWEPGSNTWT